MIKCGSHGERVSAVICQHLMQTAPAPADFVENSSDPNDLQAWCYLCEDAFQHEGDMKGKFRQFNGMAIVCVICYDEVKARHTVAANY